MKNYLIAGSLVLSLIIPTASFAQTTDAATTKAALIQELQTLLQTLIAELQQLIAQQASATSTAPVISTISSTPSYSTFTPVTFPQYQANPTAYVGQNIILAGMQDSFIPSTGAAGSNNYVEIENPFDMTQPKIELQIDNGADYTALVNTLQSKTDPVNLFLQVYGTGVASQPFTEKNLFGTYTVNVPVIKASRVDECIHGTMATTILTGTSFNDAFSCSSWSTVAPVGSAGNVTTVTPVTTPITTTTVVPSTPVTTSTPTTPTQPTATVSSDASLQSLSVNGAPVSGFSPTTYGYTVTVPAGNAQAPTVTAVPTNSSSTVVITPATNSLGAASIMVTAQSGRINLYSINFKPADVGQCNFNGNVFNCASNSAISVSPTSLPTATVGQSYSQPVSIADPDTTSQSFRWNILNGVFPPGLGFAFSSGQAIECTGTYCAFTSTPSGVSASGPGTFFGTPTTPGTYSFTFQAIDANNYVALPTFTLTVNPAATSTGQ